MRRTTALAWLVVVSVMTAYLAIRVVVGVHFSSDIMALLPDRSANDEFSWANEEVTSTLSHEVVLLVGHKDREMARKGAEALTEALEATGLLKRNAMVPDAEAMRRLGQVYFQHRAGLLAEEDARRLREGRADEIARRAMAQVYGLGGVADARLLRDDPFLLLPAFVVSLPLPSQLVARGDGWLGTERDGKAWIFVNFTLNVSPYEMSAQDRIVDALDDRLSQLRRDEPNLEAHRLGAVFFARAGAQQATREMSAFSTVATLGTILLIVVVFRAMEPLWQNLLTIAVGLVVAMSATLMVFGEPHVTTMVIGTTLIGVTVDYSVLWFCSAEGSKIVDPWGRLRRIIGGLTIGVATTLVGYAMFLMAPFPGLHQIAVFSLVGVLAAFLTVILWLPLLDRGRQALPEFRFRRLTDTVWSFWEGPRARRHLLAALFVLAALGVAGWNRFAVNDDIRTMQFLSPELVAQQARILDVTGTSTSLQYILVRGRDSDAALEKEEKLLGRLAELRRDGALVGYQAPAQFVPSAALQRENRKLVDDLLASPLLARQQQTLGLNSAPRVETADTAILTLEDVVDLLPGLRRLIVGGGTGVTHVILLRGPVDAARVSQAIADMDGVRYVDPASDISHLLGEYRRWATFLIVGAVPLTLALLLARYGVAAFRVFAPPLVGLLLAPALSALIGASFTFFDSLALLLILAIGVDYAVFCAETTEAHQHSTLLAVLVAALMTIMSFGLLGYSQVPAVHSFGMTMFFGITTTLILAPIAAKARRSRKETVK